jgi:hypothetical protein
MDVKDFYFRVYQNERPFALFGLLAPIRGRKTLKGLTLIGFEARIMNEHDIALEKIRGQKASIIQREYRKFRRYKNVRLFIAAKLKKRRNKAALSIQMVWKLHQLWKRKRHGAQTSIQRIWRRRRRITRTMVFLNTRIAKKKDRAAKKIQREWRKRKEAIQSRKELGSDEEGAENEGEEEGDEEGDEEDEGGINIDD